MAIKWQWRWNGYQRYDRYKEQQDDDNNDNGWIQRGSKQGEATTKEVCYKVNPPSNNKKGGMLSSKINAFTSPTHNNNKSDAAAANAYRYSQVFPPQPSYVYTSTHNNSFEDFLTRLSNRHLDEQTGGDNKDTIKMGTSAQKELAISMERLPKGSRMNPVTYPSPVDVHAFKRQLGNALVSQHVHAVHCLVQEVWGRLLLFPADRHSAGCVPSKTHGHQHETAPREVPQTGRSHSGGWRPTNSRRSNVWNGSNMMQLPLSSSSTRSSLTCRRGHATPYQTCSRPVGITVKVVYNHTEKQIAGTTKVLRESYLDLATLKDSGKKYFVEATRDQFQANLLKESPITDGWHMDIQNTYYYVRLTVMEEAWLTHYYYESTIGRERTVEKALVTPKYELFKEYWTTQLSEAYVDDEASAVTDALTARLAVLENRHNKVDIGQFMENQGNLASPYNATSTPQGYYPPSAPPDWYPAPTQPPAPAPPTYTSIVHTANTAALTVTITMATEIATLKAHQGHKQRASKSWKQYKFYCYLCAGVNISRHSSLKCVARGKRPDHKEAAFTHTSNHMAHEAPPPGAPQS
eukprot:jgi/Psemu1/8561/gm1.8561_g